MIDQELLNKRNKNINGLFRKAKNILDENDHFIDNTFVMASESLSEIDIFLKNLNKQWIYVKVFWGLTFLLTTLMIISIIIKVLL